MIDLKGARVLVTGATGLLGRPLVDALIKRGAIILGTGFEPRPADWPDSASYHSADLGDIDQCHSLPCGQDYIFHLAGAKGGVGIGQTRAADFMRGNLLSTINLLKAITDSGKIKRLLYVSSVGAYPGDRDVFNELDDIWSGRPHESDFFGGVAKRTGEALCEAHRQQYGMDYVVVRPTNCFGPYDRFDAETGMVIAALITRIEAGEWPLKIWGDGIAERDFLYSKDAAEQMMMVMQNGQSCEAYNLGSGMAISIESILWILKSIYTELQWQYDSEKPSGPQLRMMDTIKTQLLGGNLVTPMGPALRETVDWYRANKNYQKYDPFKK